MAKKILIAIHDDWELSGNGLGDVAHLQYLPTRFLLGAAKRFDIKLTFMVEVLQQLAFKQTASRIITLQANLWDETVCLMKEAGHDVQLHLHPQWQQHEFDGEFFFPHASWNIADFTKTERQSMLQQGIDYLTQLLKPIDANYKVSVFKAGAWAMQPSAIVMSDLQAAGIKLVLGPSLAINYRSPQFVADYSTLEESILPYYPAADDICKLANTVQPLMVVPLAYYSLSTPMFIKNKIQQRFTRRPPNKRFPYYLQTPTGLFNPFQSLPKQWNFKRPRIFDLGATSLAESIYAIDKIMTLYLQQDIHTIPLALQSHCKNYHNNENTILKFFEYLTTKYHNQIEFVTLSELLQRSLSPRMSQGKIQHGAGGLEIPRSAK